MRGDRIEYNSNRYSVARKVWWHAEWIRSINALRYNIMQWHVAKCISIKWKIAEQWNDVNQNAIKNVLLVYVQKSHDCRQNVQNKAENCNPEFPIFSHSNKETKGLSRIKEEEGNVTTFKFSLQEWVLFHPSITLYYPRCRNLIPELYETMHFSKCVSCFSYKQEDSWCCDN